MVHPFSPDIKIKKSLRRCMHAPNPCVLFLSVINLIKSFIVISIKWIYGKGLRL